MAQLFVTLVFTVLMIVAARSILRDLSRPLVNRPACWDDALYDALCDGRGGGVPCVAPARAVTPLPVRLPQPIRAAA